MLLQFISLVGLLPLLTSAAVLETPGDRLHGLEIAASMPELPGIKSDSSIQKQWYISGSTKFYEGRYILTPKPVISSNLAEETILGSLWSRPDQNPPNLDELETQLTIRSLGKIGETGAGLAYYIVNDDSKAMASYNNKIFGGPDKFNGLLITLDSNDESLGSVFRVYLNDGSKVINLKTDLIGAYLYRYQNSNVPLTLKVGYSNNWLKITCDNKLLFETDKFTITNIVKSPNLRFGITSSSPKDVRNYEQFEVLRFKAYKKVSSELRQECKQTLLAKHIDDGNESIDSKPVDKKPIESKEESIPSELVQQIYKKLNDIQLSISTKNVGNNIGKLNSETQQTVHHDINELTKTIGKLIDNVNNILIQVSNSNKRFDNVDSRYMKLEDLIKRQTELIESMESVLGMQTKSFTQQLGDLGQGINSRVSDLHKDYINKVGSQAPELSARLEKLGSFTKWILVPVALLCCAILFLLSRLRNEIQHSKVL